jgi:hypothetical protein
VTKENANELEEEEQQLHDANKVMENELPTEECDP